MRAIDHAISAIPRNVDCQVRVYIDDFDVTARAPTNLQVVRTLAYTTHGLVRTLEVGERVHFSPPKATVVADSSALACHIRTALRPRGGPPCHSATVLGVDALGGRGRCAARRNARIARTARVVARRTLFVASPARPGQGAPSMLSYRGFAPLLLAGPKSQVS